MEEESEVMHNAEATANAGWADVMQKILKANKPKGKRTVVLAKAKKLCDVKVKEKEEDLSFEIDDSKEDNTDSTEISIKTVEHTNDIAQARSRIREKSLDIRVKPSFTDRERERLLQKIATKYDACKLLSLLSLASFINFMYCFFSEELCSYLML